MEHLSAEVQKELSIAARDANFTDAEFVALARFCVAALLDESAPREPAYDTFASADRATVKTAVSGILTFLVEAVRTDLSDDAVRGLGEELGFAKSRAEVLVAAVVERRGGLRTIIGHTGCALERIVDLDWRLDYHIRSSDSGAAHQPLYIVSVKLQAQDGSVRSKQFTCNIVQMEELLLRVQDAARQVERVQEAIAGSSA